MLISTAAASWENIGPIIEDFKFQIILERIENYFCIRLPLIMAMLEVNWFGKIVNVILV